MQIWDYMTLLDNDSHLHDLIQSDQHNVIRVNVALKQFFHERETFESTFVSLVDHDYVIWMVLIQL